VLSTHVKVTAPSHVEQLLTVLRILYVLNKNLRYFLPTPDYKTKKIRSREFINHKITAKLLDQLQEPLLICTKTLPLWCKELIQECRFLFPSEVRAQYFKIIAFDVARALETLRDQITGISGSSELSQSGLTQEIQLARIQRQRVQISRDKLLSCAIKVMELVSQPENVTKVLEVEYFNEVGTGLGPTLEFYTLVSRALQRKVLNMWVQSKPSEISTTKSLHHNIETKISKKESNEENVTKNDEQSEFIFTESGTLFPAPLRDSSSPQSRAILMLFEFLGTFMAKAIFDDRRLDLPLAPSFYKLMLGETLTVEDLEYISPTLCQNMSEFLRLCQEKFKILSNPSIVRDYILSWHYSLA
jgi:E3 ubiquitin-protein ligase TRIP12